ncbi:MAG: argH, partial [Herbinix sp.]|nr:argH [Herbinix sp.]
MKLWGGRFTKETNQLVHNFNASISFDQKFFKQDIEGSIAHVTMLAKQGIISVEEKDQIISGLSEIMEEIINGSLEIGRNDQVALDMKLYTRDEIAEIDGLLKKLLVSLHVIMKANTDTFMPGFTHLQKAQPVTL